MRIILRALVLALAIMLFGPVSATAQQEVVIESTHGVGVDEEKPFPSIMFSDILKSMSDQVVWEKGQIRFFERVRMTFLPDFQDPQHIAAYNASTGAFLVSQLSNEDGEVLQTVFWEARQDRFPYWNASAVGNSDPEALSAGKYLLTWLIDGEGFWQLSFEITEAPAQSAYDQPNTYLEGPWNKWAYIYVPNGNLSQNPTFNMFLRDKAAKPGQWTDSAIEVEIKRDGELVAQHGHNKGSIQQAKPWWINQELALRTPDDSGFVSAGDILQAGEYIVTVKINGSEYAQYTYESEGGALPRAGRQDRDSAKPMKFLEGTTDRFYLKRD
jgi:hypothetical protein